jgi:hypothetical protein
MRGIEGPKTSVSRSPTDEFGCVTLSPRAKFTTNFKFSWSSGHAATSHHSTLESRRLHEVMGMWVNTPTLYALGISVID